jgi:hypothetical protein
MHQTWNLCYFTFFVLSEFFSDFFVYFLDLKKWRRKYRITPTPKELSYGLNLLFTLLFIYLTFKKEFLFSNHIYISLTYINCKFFMMI